MESDMWELIKIVNYLQFAVVGFLCLCALDVKRKR